MYPVKYNKTLYGSALGSAVNVNPGQSLGIAGTLFYQKLTIRQSSSGELLMKALVRMSSPIIFGRSPSLTESLPSHETQAIGLSFLLWFHILRSDTQVFGRTIMHR